MRKKLFAVIMSAMMMITFMPTMAFANWTITDGITNVKWAADYSSVSFKYNDKTYTADAERSYASGAWDGKITATASASEAAGVATLGAITTKFYDLTNSYISAVQKGTTWKEIAKGSNSISKTEFDGMFDTTKTTQAIKVTFLKPSYVTATGLAKSSVAKTAADISAAAGASVEMFVSVPSIDSEKAYSEDQTITLNPTCINKEIREASADCDPLQFVGDIPSRTLTVTKVPAKAENAEFVLDGKTPVAKTGASPADIYYTGSEMTVTQVAMPNITSTFKLLNNKTGKWEDVETVKFKDKGVYHIKASVKNEKDSTDTKTYNLTVDVKAAQALAFGFKKASNKVVGKVDTTKYVKADYVVVSGEATANAASKKAVAKDKTELLAFMSEAYDVALEDNGDGTYTAKMSKKEAKDFVAAEKKYEALLGNYEGYNLGISEAEFEVVGSIDFTKAPLTKTYKAKKGKLPKAKKIQIKAKASSGETLVYKLTKGAGKIVINKATGKITVKKGLKKGTYKVGVHAITISTYGSSDPIENNYTLKIKVK